MTDEQLERAFMSESISTTKGRAIALDDFVRLARAIERNALERAIRAIEIQEGWNAGARCSISAIRALLDTQSKDTEVA